MSPINSSNAYTDAPRLHPNLILGSFHLLFWLLCHPSAWRYHITRIDPTLPTNFNLADLSQTRRRIPALRRLIIQSHIVLPLLISLPVGIILWRQGVPAEILVGTVGYVLLIILTLNLMIGLVISVAAGIVGSAAVGLAVGIVGSLLGGDVAVPVAISIAMGAMGSTIGFLGSQRPVYSPALKMGPAWRAQMGGIVTGVLIGVIAIEGVRFGLTILAGLTVGLSENMAYTLARMLVVGASFGVVMGWQRGLITGVTAGAAGSLAYGLAVAGVNSQGTGVLPGFAAGLLFGASFGVTVVLPYVLAEQIAGSWAGAWAGALGSWGRHIFRNQVPLWPTLPLGFAGIFLGISMAWWRPVLLYPFLAAWNLILYRLDQRRIGLHPSLLRWHSAFWDEFQRLPLIGLDEHLLLVLEHHPAEGQAALAYVSAGRQRWAAQAVQIELEARRLESCNDIAALSQAYRRLAAGELAGPASALLRALGYASRDIESGLNQTTAYHQRLALCAIAEQLNNLARELTASSETYAPRFLPVVNRWRQLVDNHLHQLAEAVERSQEIDNPYIVGVPLTAEQEIFVGRADIVTRIEQLLLDRRCPPLLLYGQRRMGKTSLLRNLGRLLPRTIVPLFVDGQRSSLASDYPDFLYTMAGEMRKSAEQQRQVVLPPLSRESLIANPFTYFNEWLDHVEQALETQGYSIGLLALDEFEMLDNVLNKGRFDETDVLSLLRHLIQHRPRFKVMLAGSHTLAEFQRWASYLINVQVVKVGYLAETETRQLVEQPVKNFPLQYEPAAAQRVLELTRGHPALVQLLCYEIVTLKNEQDAAARRLARLADVEAAVSKALESGNFFFTDIQQNQVDPAGLALLRCLAAHGEGAVVSRAELAAASPAQTPTELDPVLAALLRRDLIEAVNGGYRFQVELIRRWFEADR